MHLLLNIQILLFHPFNLFKAFCNVPPLRNFFLEEENYKGIRRPPGDIMFLLVQRFGELMRKLWNPRNFKAHVSPHEMLQAVVLCSKKNFQITKQGNAMSLYCLYYIWRMSAGTFLWWGTVSHQLSLTSCYRMSRVPMLNVTFALLLTIVLHVFKCCYSCYYI